MKKPINTVGASAVGVPIHNEEANLTRAKAAVKEIVMRLHVSSFVLAIRVAIEPFHSHTCRHILLALTSVMLSKEDRLVMERQCQATTTLI